MIKVVVDGGGHSGSSTVLMRVYPVEIAVVNRKTTADKQEG